MKQYKAYAKVNICLKITGQRGDYHEIFSRFVLVDGLYDTLTFVSKEDEAFSILGSFSCTTEQNTIYKAYVALLEETGSDALVRLSQTHAIKVEKKIPAFAGLGGGSSDAATYLLMCNEVLHLGLSREQLAIVGAKVGADVPFFIYGFQSANVTGVGEIVQAFDEPNLNIQTITPNIEISTPKVYQTFRKQFYKVLGPQEVSRLSTLSSAEILSSMTPTEANDLFEPALLCYPELQKQQHEGWYFSGSGSSFFTVR